MKITGSLLAAALLSGVLSGCGSEMSKAEACEKAESVAGRDTPVDSDGREEAASVRDDLQEISDDASTEGRNALAPAIEALDFIAENGNEGYQPEVSDGLDATVDACGWK